jgi:hypothetical protein
MTQQQQATPPSINRPPPWWRRLWWIWPAVWLCAMLLIRDRVPHHADEVLQFVGFVVVLLCGSLFPFFAYSAWEDRRKRQVEGEARGPFGGPPEREDPTWLWVTGGVVAFVLLMALAQLEDRGHLAPDTGEDSGYDYTHTRSIQGK